ncbi:MAG: SLC13 family permease [Bacteroidota bacterium]|nr:DASS family sodium-coupled anion symporter [Kiloniellaceae bacterium]
MTPSNSAERGRLPLLGLVGGPLAGAMLLLLPPPAGLEPAAWSVAAVTLLMVVWWITEALPVAATALVPIVAFPLLGVAGIGAATAPYAHPLIFLFLGGFLLAKAIERCNLHRRTALTILGAVGAAPHRLIGGFMAATAALSMWLSNTATAIMMLPIALAVIGLLGPRQEAGGNRFAVALLLGIAYAASIGGIGTLIGTPPNALLAAFLAERYGIVIGFGRWMLFGLPLAAVLLALCWLLLTRVVFRVGRQPIPGAAETIAAELRGLGRASRDERMVAAVFATVAALWVLRPLINDALPMLGLSDTGIALLGGLALFAIPADLPRRRFLLDWEAAKTLPWGVLLLFGGGLSLASAIESSGLAAWIGALLEARAGWPVVAVVLLVTALVVFLTEVTSNTATASVFIPIAAGLGAGAAEAPLLYATAVALSASCAFMMPVATPPNAIVYASGELTIPQMARAGLWLNLVCIVVITAAVSWLAGPLLGLAP